MKNQLNQLIANYHKSLKLEPKNAHFFGKIAEFYYTQGNLEDALTACQQALRIQPDLEIASTTLQKILQAKKQADINSLKAKSVLNNWLILDADSIVNYPDAIDQLYQDDFVGIQIKKVFSKAEITKVVHNLESKQDRIIPWGFGGLIGVPILQPEVERTQYFKESAFLRAELNDIFETSFEARIEAVLSKISGSRIVEIPKENEHDVYIPATFRILDPKKCSFQTHNEAVMIEKFDNPTGYLKQIAKLQNSLNYFIVLDKPEQGGELVLYDLVYYYTPQQFKKEIFMNDETEAAFAKQFSQKHFDPDLGDLVLFKSGRWHKISPVKGEKNRLTIGGLISVSKDNRKMFYWD